MCGASTSGLAPRAPPALQDESRITKAQLKKIKADARAEGERDAKRKWGQQGPGQGAEGQLSKRQKKLARQQLALTNGGVGDGQRAAPPPAPHAGARASKGKGKGKGKGKDMYERKPICYNWHRNAPCKSQDCQMAHVRLVCHGNHRKVDNAACNGGG